MHQLTEITLSIAVETWRVLLAAAPWLLLGLLLAGVLRAWLPDRVVARWLGGSGPGAVIRAALIGTPLPLCSCGVVPTAIGLRRQGASRPATVSFLVATPENGADSIALTYALMGPVMAVARPVAALASAVTAGVLSLAFATRTTRDPRAPQSIDDATACDCCHTDTPPPLDAPRSACADDTPDASPTATHTTDAPLQRLARGIRYAFTRLLDDLAPWLAVGLLLAGLLAALVPPDAMAAWGRGPLAMLLMALVGVPIYVCATSFTPVGASLIVAGVSPGAVLVLLLAGPATNIGTIGIVRRELGWATLVAYLFGVIGVSIASGLALDALISAADLPVVEHAAHAEHVLPAWFAVASAIALAILAIRPARRAVALPLALLRRT